MSNTLGIIEFDVGGRILKTLRGTLSNYPMSKLWKTVLRKDEELRKANKRENTIEMDIDQIIID